MLYQLIATLFSVYVVHSAHKQRTEQLERMKSYITSYLQPVAVDEDTMTLEFDAFDQHYEVELWRQTHATPSNVEHTNVDSEVHSPLSSRQESCHFHGAVTNFEGLSVVSASLCEGRGIRARINAFDEILIIKPSAYYLDLDKDSAMTHSFEDEVLMYKMSEFEHPDRIHGGIPMEHTQDAVGQNVDDIHRRRLYAANQPAENEVTVLVGPVRTNNYKTKYPSNWYDQLYSDVADMMNSVDAIYVATNWNANGRSSVGPASSLRVRFAEIHVVYSFTGSYASMMPTKRFTNCPLGANEFDDSDACAIIGNEWLSPLSTWVDANMDTSKYDNVQMLTDIKFNWQSCNSQYGGTYVCSRTLGWGNIGVICKGSSSVSAVSVVEGFGGIDGAVGSMAHEMGHNFGLYHDGQSGPAQSCGADDGLMGYGDNHETFSTCSLDSMQTYYTGDGSGLQCLGEGWNGKIASNVGSEVSVPTAAPVVIPTLAPTPPTPAPTYGTSDQCLHIELGYDNFDGTWDAITGGYGGKNAYRIQKNGNERFLYYKELTWNGMALKWIMGGTMGSNSMYFCCSKEDLLDCNGNWLDLGSGNTYTTFPNSVTNTNCVPTGTLDTSCSSYDCISVTGTSSFDGQYNSGLTCNDGQRVFESSNGNYLCYSAQRGRWLMSDSVCSLSSVISSSTTGDVLSPSYWMVNTDGSNYQQSNGISMADCGANQPFHDMGCLDDMDYENEICVSTNSSWWAGGVAQTFGVYNELCSNDQPIYRLIVELNETTTIGLDGAVVDATIQEIFYVHYQPQKLLVTDEEATGQWMMSKNEISIEYIAVCRQENLMKCTASNWKRRVTQFGEENSTIFGGIVLDVLDNFMTVSDGACGSSLNTEESGWGQTETVVVAVVVVLLVIICIAGYCIWRRMNLRDSMAMKEALDGPYSLMATGGTAGAEQQNDVEVEVEVEADNQITRHFITRD